MERSVLHSGVRVEVGIEEMGVLWTESERPKTNATRRVYVGEERKRSWSRGESILRIGTVKCMLSSAGGEGSGGVAGAGSNDTEVDDLRWRGTRRGILAAASMGIGAAGNSVAAIAMIDVVVVVRKDVKEGQSLEYLIDP